MMGTGSMGINISKLLRCHTAVFQGVQHGGGCSAAVLRRGGDMIGIRRTAVAGQFRIDLRSASLCMLQFFQYHYRRAFSHNKAIAVFIERNRSSLRVFTKRQCCQCGKSGNSDGGNGAFRSSRYHYIRITVLDRTVCFSDGMCTGCAGSHHIQALALQPIGNADIACCHIGDHQRHQHGSYPAGTFFLQAVIFPLHGL